MADIHSTQETGMPAQSNLLPNEMAVRIGCFGCNSAIAACYRVGGARYDRNQLIGDIKTASELTGIPARVVISTGILYENASTGVDCAATAFPCEDPDNASLINELTDLVGDTADGN